MKFGTYLAAAAALALAPMAAQAQDVGATVMGNDDNAIGQVTSNDGTTVVVNTGTYEVPLPVDSFGTSEAGPTLNITKVQLEEMMAQQVAAQQQAEAERQAAIAAQEAEMAAALEAALVPGAAVITADAQALGTVGELLDGNVVVSKDGELVTLPSELFAVDAEGQLMVLANLADIEAAMGG